MLQQSRRPALLPEAVAAGLRAASWTREAAAESWRLLRAATLSEEECLESGQCCRAGECTAPAAKERLGDLDTPGRGLWSVLWPGPRQRECCKALNLAGPRLRSSGGSWDQGRPVGDGEPKPPGAGSAAVGTPMVVIAVAAKKWGPTEVKTVDVVDGPMVAG
ncbi:hypothetical protein NDU88_005676 [Pleurodeles waltl]|uniref:Uncharacterized protein n=1 Tax=Pleurodeles waltl TaxID=8319 RepID=A0AAV7LLS6_PLEWA|nr:hypothetical protein NDU88_005676 [Pleurodeles waltl]